MAAGTLEVLAREFALVLEPLEERLDNGGALELFTELGLRFPPELMTLTGVTNAITATGTVVGDLPPLVIDLTDAILAEDEITITAVGFQLLLKVGTVISSISTLAQAIHAARASIPDLTETQIIDFTTALPGRLIDLLVVEYLETRLPAVTSMLDLIGLIERTPVSGDINDPSQPPYMLKRLHLNRLGDLVQAPEDYLEDVYGWGAPTFDGRLFLSNLCRFLGSVNVPAYLIDEPPALPVLEAYIIALQVNTATTPPGLLLTIGMPAIQDVDLDIPLSNGWIIRLTSTARFNAGVEVTLTPPADLSLTVNTGTVDVGLRTGLIGERPGNPYIVIGQTGGSRLEVGKARLELGFDASWDTANNSASGEPVIEGELSGGKLIIDTSGGSGVLSTLLSNLRVDAPFNLSVTWRPSTGARFEGNAALDIRQPTNITLGPLTIQTLYMRAGFAAGGQIPIELSGGMSLALGPLLVSVDRLGVEAVLTFRDGDGNLGALDFEIAFKPPTGLGLLVDAGVIKGGGFLNIDPGPPERYAGALSLKLTNFAVVAFGIFERTPSGRIAFVMVLGIRFFPGFQLGFGFALTGVGGMIGLNRRADVDALRERLVSGGASNVLFCEDPISNAPTILGDLAAIFPAADGIFVVGPTFQIGWLVFVRFDLGIIIELPGPSKIVLIGSARFQVGGEAGVPAVVQIRLDILGIIDIPKKMISFDAALVNSTIMQIFHLTGTAAFRLSGGDRPYVLLTIGGFHPAFNPEPAVVPPQSRVALTYETIGAARLSVRLEAYLAITTNTFQVGAALEAKIEAGPFNANGFLGFDALIQFVPFKFTIDFSAGFRVRYKSHTLAGVKFNGKLTGPGPITLSGKLCIEILFFDICFSHTFVLGDPVSAAVNLISSLVQELAPELDKPANLTPVGAEDREVAITPTPTGSKTVVIPQGQLAWTQKRAPLNLALDRLEGVPLSQPQAIVVESSAAQGAAQEWFSPGTFMNLSQSEAMNQPPFQRLDSGILVGFGSRASAIVDHTVDFETIRLPEENSLFLDLLAIPAVLLDAIAERRAPGQIFAAAKVMSVTDETWSVTSPNGSLAADGLSPADAHQRARMSGAAALPSLDAQATIDLGGI